MIGWIKKKRERHNRLYTCDINLGNEMTPKQSLKVWTLPLTLALCTAVSLHYYLDNFAFNKADISSAAAVIQEPVLRQLFVEARTFDGRAMSLTINGRQVKNTELAGWCDIAWTGKIQKMVNFAGTIEVEGQMMVDSWVNRTESGMLDEIKYDLQGSTIESRSCIMDILTVELKER